MAVKLRRRRPICLEVLDAPDRAAAEVDVEQVPRGPDLEMDGICRRREEVRARGRVGQSVRALGHHPQAVTAVVGKEERAVVRVGVGATGVERHPHGRRALAVAARLAADDRVAVAIGVVGRHHGAGPGRVQVLADVEVQGIVRALPPDALVARPSEVVHGGVGRGHEPVQLLPRRPSHVAGPDLVRARADRDPERVAEAIADDPTGIRVGAGCERVTSHARPRSQGRHAGRRRSGRGVAGRAQVLAPERATLRRG